MNILQNTGMRILRQLSLENLIPNLKEFWPRNGPQWDALAKSKDKVFLVEAKANLPELISPPCGAKSKDSIQRIHSSLLRTKSYLSSTPIEADWSSDYYQYTNRISHLYFLRSNGINAYLIFLYFVGDKSVHGPSTIDEWISAKESMEEFLKLPSNHKLSDYIIDIFIHVNEII